MIIAVGGGTDFNCQWNASTWSDEGKKKSGADESWEE